MFYQDEIKNFTDRLASSKLKLYHACQLKDFKTYVYLNGIPSRKCMQDAGAEYTAFDTDETDKENAVWDKVFVNLHDFGNPFAKGAIATPNAFGPISLHIKPQALDGCQDVAICLRSAGAQGFDRGKEALKFEQIDELFVRKDEREYVKFGSQLRNFRHDAHDPEVSCSTPLGLIPFSNVAYIIVDDIQVAGVPLKDLVEGETDKKVIIRDYKEDRAQVLTELVDSVVTGGGELLNPGTKAAEWIAKIGEAKLTYQLDRYTKYLWEGTLA